MEVEFLLGKSKTGKSKYIYERIKKDIEEGIYDILFVPSQKRLITEEAFMEELNLTGIIGVDITTISSFVLQNLKKNNLNFENGKISKLDKKLLLARTVTKNQDLFKLFSKVTKKQGFLDSLYIYMDLFEKENVNTDGIKNIKLNDRILEEKLKEISSIYDVYNQSLKDTFVNNVDEISLFIKEFAHKENFKGKNIFFDGYNNFTNNELLFIEFLLKSGANVRVSLTTDIATVTDIYSGNTEPIFEVANNTYKKLLKICDKNNIEVNNNLFYNNYSKSKESLKYLADNLFSTDFKEKKENINEGINIYLKSNSYAEIRSIARDICKKIREGYRYSDFVMYTTDIEGYSSVIQRIFYEYNIPYYIDIKRKIEGSKLTDYIKKLLKIYSDGLNYENVINILKLRLNDVDEKDVSKLENYVNEFNLLKSTLKKELTANNENSKDYIYDLNELNSLRKKVVDIFGKDQIVEIEKVKVSKIVDNIYDHLTQNNIFLNYDKSNNQVNLNNGDTFFEEQVWNKLNEVFVSIDKIYKEEEITLKEFGEVFNFALSEVYIKSIPPSIDNVSVVDINVSKLKSNKMSYFLGVNEGCFPKQVKEDVFFSDFDLEKLENKNIEFKETSLSKLNMGMYNIYEAISNTLEYLNIYILSSDNSGKALRPSSLITLINQVINVDIVGDITSKDVDYDVYSKEQIFQSFIDNCINDNVSLTDAALFNYFSNQEVYSKVLNYTKNDNNLSKESIEQIYGNSLTTSVSRLELFKRCPFSYFMQYSLNVNPNVEYEITSLDTGTFMHNVLEEFSKFLLKNNIYWQGILENDETVKDEYIDKLYEIVDRELKLSLKRHKNNIKFVILKQKLVNTMKNVILIIAKSFNQSEFAPYGYEIEFKEGGVFTPIEIKVSDNYYMKLIGKIDRVDIYETEENSYIRVIDYKSSSRSLDLDDVREGISLQLVTYLTAFMDNLKKKGKNVIPAGCVYFNLSDKLVNISDYTNSEDKLKSEIIKALRLKGIFLRDAQILEKMDKKLSDKDNRMLDISTRSLDKDTKKALDKDNFIKLSEDIKDTLKDIGEEMVKGVVKISPNKKCDHCKYCKYMSICRKDSRL